MFKKLRINNAAHRIAEEALYEQAIAEVESGKIRGGLWAKALANSAGDEQSAKGLYLKYRVQSMVDEAALTENAIDTFVDGRISKSKSKIKSDSLSIYNFRPLTDFAKLKDIPEEKVIKMVRDGFYHGRLFDGVWYVHKSEFGMR